MAVGLEVLLAGLLLAAEVLVLTLVFLALVVVF
jgi:hypothetical protein